MKNLFAILFVLTFLLNQNIHAQEKESNNPSSYVEVGFGLNNDASVLSAGYYRNWKLSADKKILKNIYIGTGLRFNGFGAKDIYFTSAPPSLFGTADEDSILAPAPAIYSVNLLINLGYQITPKLQVGFDIDLLGASFGPNGSPNFISNGVSQTTKVNPTPMNILLIGANDRGSLSSNCYVGYKFTDRWGARLSFQPYFAEITTEDLLQTVPEDNQRFRHATAVYGLGVNYSFK